MFFIVTARKTVAGHPRSNVGWTADGRRAAARPLLCRAAAIGKPYLGDERHQ
jgi:hypothetical protein